MGRGQCGPLGVAGDHPGGDSGTTCLSTSPTPSPTCSLSEVRATDELTPVATYMAAEINANAHGADAQRMAQLNSFSPDACIHDFSQLPLWQQLVGLGLTPEECVRLGISYQSAALLIWSMKVRQDGDWDHKPKIASRFHPRTTSVQHWHRYGYTLYYYDVWSNLHYGYVGTAAGFSESTLLDGAGLEQIGSTLLRGKLPAKSTASESLRAWDDPSDQAGIRMGISLYRRKPRAVTAEDLLRLVTGSAAITTKPVTH